MAPTVLVLGWGSTFGAIAAGVAPGAGPGLQGGPRPPASISTRSRPTWARCSTRYDKVLVPEVNLGQLAKLVRADFLVDAQSLNKVQGVPFRAAEIEAADPRAARRRAVMTDTADPA